MVSEPYYTVGENFREQRRTVATSAEWEGRFNVVGMIRDPDPWRIAGVNFDLDLISAERFIELWNSQNTTSGTAKLSYERAFSTADVIAITKWNISSQTNNKWRLDSDDDDEINTEPISKRRKWTAEVVVVVPPPWRMISPTPPDLQAVLKGDGGKGLLLYRAMCGMLQTTVDPVRDLRILSDCLRSVSIPKEFGKPNGTLLHHLVVVPESQRAIDPFTLNISLANDPDAPSSESRRLTLEIFGRMNRKMILKMVSMVNAPQRLTVLQLICGRNGRLSTLSFLLPYCDTIINHAESETSPPIFEAIKYRRYAAISALLNHPEFDMSVYDRNGDTVLHAVCRYKNPSAAALIIPQWVACGYSLDVYTYYIHSRQTHQSRHIGDPDKEFSPIGVLSQGWVFRVGTGNFIKGVGKQLLNEEDHGNETHADFDKLKEREKAIGQMIVSARPVLEKIRAMFVDELAHSLQLKVAYELLVLILQYLHEDWIAFP